MYKDNKSALETQMVNRNRTRVRGKSAKQTIVYDRGHGRGKMKFVAVLARSIGLFAVTFGITISFVLLNHEKPHPIKPEPMARSFVLWLHGLGDSGPANEPIKTFFTSQVFANTKWSFPSAPSNPVTCNCKLSSVFILYVFVCKCRSSSFFVEARCIFCFNLISQLRDFKCSNIN